MLEENDAYLIREKKLLKIKEILFIGHPVTRKIFLFLWDEWIEDKCPIVYLFSTLKLLKKK